jgi:hypothetical protein
MPMIPLPALAGDIVADVHVNCGPAEVSLSNNPMGLKSFGRVLIATGRLNLRRGSGDPEYIHLYQGTHLSWTHAQLPCAALPSEMGVDRAINRTLSRIGGLTSSCTCTH